MSEEILKVFLADLQVIRLVCQRCESVIELSVLKLEEKMKDNACPVCGRPFTASADDAYNVFPALERAFRRLEAIKGFVKVEFPVRVDAPPPGDKP